MVEQRPIKVKPDRPNLRHVSNRTDANRARLHPMVWSVNASVPRMHDRFSAGALHLRVLAHGDTEELHPLVFSDPATHTIGTGPFSDIDHSRMARATPRTASTTWSDLVRRPCPGPLPGRHNWTRTTEANWSTPRNRMSRCSTVSWLRKYARSRLRRLPSTVNTRCTVAGHCLPGTFWRASGSDMMLRPGCGPCRTYGFRDRFTRNVTRGCVICRPR